ncbi:RNA-dependent ATPase [Perkinsus olseni]|uniref:RNA helicase n=2 Tax=Perkinsus olseni TaxID=32597 RepID=A0A7J6LKZ3_PEROL|nr:RNA-dependent ATPase [Perkinsus olseni]KAF4659843.1 RNA-dependent ATPase [Perkinsus olseni]KAF4735390.1 RNA-dependent ATPase [Perkinsus olseni]
MPEAESRKRALDTDKVKSGPPEVIYGDSKIEVAGLSDPSEVPLARTFDESGLRKSLKEYLKEKFSTPSAIQAACWPLLLSGLDVVGVAETGSGKTLGFALPFMSKAMHKGDDGMMMVLSPTRELARQIHEVIVDVDKKKQKLPSICLYGGTPKWEQQKQLKAEKPRMVIGTPGRVLDLLQDGSLDLSKVNYAVLDEADRMLDMGFLPSVTDIFGYLPAPDKRQSLMFSATWNKEVRRLSRKLMKRERITVTVMGSNEKKSNQDELTANTRITQTIDIVHDRKPKMNRLWHHLGNLCPNKGVWKVIVFALYKKEAAHLERMLRDYYDVVGLHGDMTQVAREASIKRFTEGQNLILVATDVAARGLDVKDVSGVINYTFPLVIEDYVHRIGRTGRAGRTGHAVTIFNAEEEKQFAFDLKGLLERCGQTVPEGLAKLANQTGGFKASKKKVHPIYGAFFKDEEEMAKLEAKKTHVTFSDDEDDD